jgi:flagellar hook-associated protein FlgK
MNTISSIGRSGMNAAQFTLGTSAHNIANQATPDFRRQRVLQADQAGGGVTASVGQADVPGGALAEDMVTQKLGLYAFKASLRAIQAGHEMLGSLLDVKA